MNPTRKLTPVIVICKENHGDRYFYAETEADLRAVCVKILKDRMEEGCWYQLDDEYGGEQPLTEDVIKSLPERLQKAQSDLLTRFRRWQRGMEEEKEWLEMAKAAIAGEGTALDAKRLLDHRSDYEYERVLFEKPEQVDTAPAGPERSGLIIRKLRARAARNFRGRRKARRNS